MREYSLNPRLREVYIARLVTELRTISGVAYERFGCHLMDRVVPVPLLHRGINLDGAPVGYTLDSASSDGCYVAEYSSETTYFGPGGKKLRKDVRHALSHHPQVKHLWLVNNTEAGEKRSAQLRNTVSRIKTRCGINIEVFDSRRTAEFIVDNLLLNSSATAVLGEYLPSLRTFAAEMAATFLVPDPSPNFVPRTDETNQLLLRLETERVIVLSGVSGTGKSDLAADIVGKVKSKFHIAAWIDAKEISDVNQLGKFDVTGSGATMNILGALSERSAIVVLDDAHASVSLDALRAKCSESSRVIVTTQIALPNSVEIGPLRKDEAFSLLSSGIAGPLLDDEVLETVRANVGSNALALSLLHAHKRETGCSWRDLVEVSASADALLDERQIKLATRLLRRAQQSIASELDFLRWSGIQTVDRGLARFVISPVGISNIERFKLLSLSRPRSLRLHELVFKAINTTVRVDQAAWVQLDDQFAEYIGLHAPSKDIEFYTVIYHHRKRIEAELNKGNARPALQYAYFLSTPPNQILQTLVPVPSSVLSRFLSAPLEQSSELAVMACIEALEKNFLRIRQQDGVAAGEQYVKSLLPTYKAFTELPAATNRLQSLTKHHCAKALRRTGDIGSARALFEDILAGPYPLESSRLQLARIYTELGCKEDSLSLLKHVLDSAVENPDGVAATVLLESVRQLLHPALKPESQELFHHYRRKIADRIVLLASIGFGQAFETFSVVASSWAYSDPVLFEEVFRSLPPMTSEEQMSGEERGAWGEVFLAASSNTKDPVLKEEFGLKAFNLLSVFRNSTDEFKRQRFAKSQLQLGDFSGAAETLEKTAPPARKEWWHYWRGKAYAGLQEYSKAVEEFDTAIQASKAPRSAFFASRAEARAAMFDSKCIGDLETAIQVGVENEEYETVLREQLRLFRLHYAADSSISG